MAGSAKVWILAARPKTLPAAIAPVMIGCVMAVSDGFFHLWSALATICAAIMIQVGTNLANDYFDFKKGIDSEGRLGPTRVTQSGMVRPETVRTATAVAFGLAFLIGIYLVYLGGLPILIIGLLSILFGVIYTAGPWPLGYIGIADLFVLIFFGPVALGGTYYVQAMIIKPEIIIAGLGPGFLSMAILTVNNLRDIDTDRSGGRKTLAVRFGLTFTRIQYLFSIIAAGCVPIYLCLFADRSRLVLLPLIIWPLAFPVIKKMFTQSGANLNDCLAKTGLLLLLYSLLFSIGWLL
ncbi:MAG: 1,4-dihydroxy-2-naphthoate polyprenyltransferase [candidate division Zixibacteria bacterium]